jgi:putative ABC transport system permease protein
MWTIPSGGSVLLDARYAVRSLARQPGFSLVTIAILASVTGLNTSLFTFFNALAFHAPSGIGHSASVVSLYPAGASNEPPIFSLGEYEALAERAQSLTVAAAAPGPSVEVGDRGPSGTVRTLIVSGSFFDTLEIPIVRGRAFRADEDRSNAPVAVAVLSASVWESRFGSDPGILDRSITLNGIPFTIVGIASRDFVGLEPAVGGRPEVILTRASHQLLRGGGPSRGIGFARIVGRLHANASRERAAAEATTVLQQFHAEQGTTPRAVIAAGTAFLSQPGRGVIFVVLGMIEVALLLVWLLACANIGNLQLARAAARAQEIAIRLSLGASRLRVVRQLLTEGLVLATVASLLAVGIAYLLPSFLVWAIGDSDALSTFNFSLAPDRLVLGFAVLLGAASAVGFGLAPALHASRADVVAALKRVDNQAASKFPLRAILLAIQVAVSVVVLVGAGLLLRRVQQQSTIDPGVPVDEITVVTISSSDGPIEGRRRYGLVMQLSQSLRQLSIGQFGFSTMQPFTSRGASVEVRLPGEQSAQVRRVPFAGVTPGYFRAMGIRFIAGRDVDASDTYRAVAIVNESMARRYWPHDHAIGRTFVLDRSETIEVIGIVSDLSSGIEASGPMFYRPLNPSTPSGMRLMARNGAAPDAGGGPIPFLIVRRARPGATDAIAATVADIDPKLRVKAEPLAQTLEEIRRGFRIGPLLAGLLGVFALALATVGMSGVFALAVKQRTREIGIRMALGAQSADVVRLILGGHSRAVVIGLGAGLLGSLSASQAMRGFLLGVSPFDPLAYLGVAAILAAAGMAASYVPARRATRVDPIAALRCE